MEITEKEFRKLKRTDLIEIIAQYQQREEKLTKENEKLRCQLEEKQIRIRKAGSIAQASLALNRVFEDAQNAAEQYLQNIYQAGEEHWKDWVKEDEEQTATRSHIPSIKRAD